MARSMRGKLARPTPVCVATALLLWLAGCASPPAWQPDAVPTAPYLVVLGLGQDGGVPQTGDLTHPGWTDPSSGRLVASLAAVDPGSGSAVLFDATPDLPEHLYRLGTLGQTRLPDIFVTHAHMGHYTGLMFLGHESLGAQGVRVHAMPRMADYLRSNGPWSQLVGYGNIQLMPTRADSTVQLGVFRVTPIEVPHRQEFSEVVGYRIEGPGKAVLFIPDIDSWEDWDRQGRRIEDELARVDVAFLDGTFYENGEIPGRDMSGFPHPFITRSISRFESLAPEERAKIHFIHLNHSNPALFEGEATRAIRAAGMQVAREGQILEL